jgi:hypothetical protein
MLPFVLYFIAALIIGFHLYELLSLVAYSIPINPLELVAFFGSFGLLIAAYISLFRPRTAAKVALIAALAIWSFYAPGIVNLMRAK